MNGLRFFSRSTADDVTSLSSTWRASRIGWLSVVVAAPLAWAILAASGMQLVVLSFLPLTMLVLMLGAAHIVYSHLRPDQRLALCSGVLAMLIAACLLAAIISHAGLRFRFPFVDAALSAADSFLGVDTPHLALAMALHPIWGAVLAIVYESSFPAIFLTAMALSVWRQERRAGELASCFALCILTASAVSVVFPALDSMIYHHVDRIAGLPHGAGNYHLDAVRYFRDSRDPAFDIGRISGVVTMPSFHMVMALLVPWALRGMGPISWTAIVWSLLVMLSTIAIGGHYVVDLIAGAALWAISVWLVQSGRESMARPPSVPACDEGVGQSAPA